MVREAPFGLVLVFDTMVTLENSSWLLNFYNIFVFKTIFANSNIFIISKIIQLAKEVSAIPANGHSTFSAVMLLKEELGKFALANVAVGNLRIDPERSLRFLDGLHPFNEVPALNLNSVIIKTEFLLTALYFKCKSFLLVIVCDLMIVAVISVNRIHLD